MCTFGMFLLHIFIKVLCFYFIVQIFAEEGSTAEKWKANCTVTIRLKDVNEFDPEFPLSSYYGYIKENSASDSLVVTVGYSVLRFNEHGTEHKNKSRSRRKEMNRK